MNTYRCPQYIFDMFEDENQIPQARKKAIEWAGKLPIKMGDKVIMPDGETGVEMEFTVTRPPTS